MERNQGINGVREIRGAGRPDFTPFAESTKYRVPSRYTSRCLSATRAGRSSREASLATELPSARGSIPDLPGTVQAIDDLPQEQLQICAGRQDLGVGCWWAVTGARRAKLGSDPGPSRPFTAPALALSLSLSLSLSAPEDELTSLGCCGSGGVEVEEAVHGDDGRRRRAGAGREASNSGKRGGGAEEG